MRIPVFCLAVSALMGAESALAQVPDPMRPADLSEAPAVGASTVKAADSGVQVVILRSGGKSAAVINGQHIEVGGKLGDKRVLKISESEVILKGANGREVLKVMPAIEKMPTKQVVAPKRRTTGSAE